MRQKAVGAPRKSKGTQCHCTRNQSVMPGLTVGTLKGIMPGTLNLSAYVLAKMLVSRCARLPRQHVLCSDFPDMFYVLDMCS